jgi:hypothetical protein
MNLGDIELLAYDRLNLNTSPDSALRRQVRADINITHRQILSAKGHGILRRKTLPAMCIASTPFMVLPQSATSIYCIVDRANNRTLDPCELSDIRFRDPGQNFTGSVPDLYAVVNFASVVEQDPVSGSASLFIVSDDARDGSGTSITVEGVLADGTYRRVSIAMNGLTGVNISSTISTWAFITKFYSSSLAAGNITLHEATVGGNELSRIRPGQTYPRYTQLCLSGIPATAQTYYCDVELHVEDMTNGTDEPLVPEDYHWLLLTGALKRYYQKRRDFEAYRVEASDWEMGMGDLGAFLRRRAGIKIGGQRQTRGRRVTQFSNSPWMNG